MMRECITHANAVICVARSLAHLAINELGADPAKVHVVGNGVDLSRFTPETRDVARERLQIPQDATVLLSVGHLTDGKGFHRVIPLLPRLREEFPRLIYVIVGADAPHQNKEAELRSLANAHGVGDMVRFAGRQLPDQLRWFYSAADLFVLATAYEGWANVFLEAMACGLPIVSTRVGGNEQVIPRDELGTLVEFWNPDAFLIAIQEALRRKYDRAALQQHAQANGWDRRIDDLVSLLSVSIHETCNAKPMHGPRSPVLRMNAHRDYMTGLFKCATWISSPKGQRAKLPILKFHRVLAAKDSLLPSEPDAEEFETWLRWLNSQFNLLPLREACDLLYAGKLPARAAAVTFDDGYADTLEVALPILRTLGIPATCFVATGFSNTLMTNDRIIEAFRHSKKSSLDASALGLGRIDLTTSEARYNSLIATIERIKYAPPVDQISIVEQLEEALEYRETRPMMLTEEQVRKAHLNGVHIGSHTRNHFILTTLEDELAFREIITGRDDIERITGVRPALFAYPNGQYKDDFDARHIQMIRDAGFSYAFTTNVGRASMGTDPLRIPRFTPWDSTPFRYRFRMLLNNFGLQH